MLSKHPVYILRPPHAIKEACAILGSRVSFSGLVLEMFAGAPLAELLARSFDSPSQLCDLADSAEDLLDVLSEGCASENLSEPEVLALWEWLKPHHRRKRAKLRDLSDRCAVALLRGGSQKRPPEVSAEAGFAEGWVVKGRRRRWPTRLKQWKHLGDKQRQDAEGSERSRWGSMLFDFVMEMRYPLAEAVREGHVDRNVATQSLLGLRAGTLRLRARRWQKFRTWLEQLKGRPTPSNIYEVAEYIMHLSTNGCGKTVPQDVLNALHTLERIGDVQPDDAWATRSYLKNQIKEAEMMCNASLDVKRAPTFLIALLVSLELFIVSDRPKFVRAHAWVRLVKLWACMRADDFQGVDPELVETDKLGLRLTIRRSKTTGPGKKHKVVWAFVSRHVSLAGTDWLDDGARLWQSWSSKRDHFHLQPRKDLEGVTTQMQVVSK